MAQLEHVTIFIKLTKLFSTFFSIFYVVSRYFSVNLYNLVMIFHRYSNVVYHEYCSCLRSSFGAVHTYMYIHCAFPASFVVQCTSDRTNVCVCVYLRKVRENERTPRASYVSHQNARELRTTVIRYCDKSSNQVSFFLPFFQTRLWSTDDKKQSIC